jgi:tetratricopeptide (TPR) repeat protein
MLTFPRLAVLWLVASPGAASAQQHPTRPGGLEEARRALELCDAAAEAGDEAAAEAAAGAAEGAAAALPRAQRPDALTVRAQVLTRCRIPFAGFMQQGALVEEANRMLAAALAAAPPHLDARFNLALNHYRTPAFLGRRPDALVAFEQVIARHGTVDDPRVAASYELLGELYAEVGRQEDAAATWRRGAELFSDHEGLRDRSGSLPPLEPGATPPDTGRFDPPAGAADPNVPAYELEPLVVEAGGYSMDDSRTATRVTKLDVYTLPGGTADVLQTFRTMPGVTQVTDGADLYVRGGDPAEAPIWVDGARLFHAGKFETLHGSLSGVLDPASLRRAYFSRGGFSAR